MTEYMTNFTASDMPSVKSSKTKSDADKKTTDSKSSTKKADAPKTSGVKNPAVKEFKAPEQTDTKTHGVGPSTVEGKAAEKQADSK